MPIAYNDPIFGQVAMPDQFRSVLESSVLARIRNIRQLGFTLVSYPGAVHTRFEHTVGTAYVLLRLMDQLEVKDESTRSKFVMSALVSEIGIYPLSYSARPIFRDIGLTKREISDRLFRTYLQPELRLSEAEVEFLLNPRERHAEWFAPICGEGAFSYLDPVKLSSTIDYVLRDSYYTGRMAGGFDYRFFSSIRNITESNYAELEQSLRALHRAVNDLNQTYGDPLRRAITRVLYELVIRLSKRRHLNLEELVRNENLLSLDDDELLYCLGAAVEIARGDGDELSNRMYEIVTQRVAADIETVSLFPDQLDRNTDVLREEIADRLNIETENVLLLGSPFDHAIGFRMFGTEFDTYEQAIMSDHFASCTGLDPAYELSRLQAFQGQASVLIL